MPGGARDQAIIRAKAMFENERSRAWRRGEVVWRSRICKSRATISTIGQSQ